MGVRSATVFEMELTKFQRDVIARAAALGLGLFLAYLSYGCLRWGERIRNDPITNDLVNQAVARHAGKQLPMEPLMLPYTLMAFLGIIAIAFVGFAVLPTQMLYRIDPTPSEVFE